MNVTFADGEPSYDDIDVKWLNGGPHPGGEGYKCSLCGRSAEEGTYVLVNRRTGKRVGGPCPGLRCPHEHGDLDMDGHPLFPFIPTD